MSLFKSVSNFVEGGVAGQQKEAEKQTLNVETRPYSPSTHGPVFSAYQSNDQKKRLILLGHVMLVVAAMLACTAIVAGFAMTKTWNYWVLNHVEAIFFCSLPVAFCSLLATETATDPKSSLHPFKHTLLSIFTLSESALVALSCAIFAQTPTGQALVVEAFVATAVMFVALAAFAMQTKFDFTPFNIGCAMFLKVMILYSVSGILFGFSPGLVYLYAGVLLFSVLVIIDVQMILTRLDRKDAILGAITLYLDIINLFLKILQILNELEKAKQGQRRRKF